MPDCRTGIPIQARPNPRSALAANKEDRWLAAGIHAGLVASSMASASR
jgi:hypothetical protein